jgi:hypothetical protein
MKENENYFNREFPLWSFKFKASSRIETLSRKDLEAKLITKALKDKAFKQTLLQNGKATVEQMFNIQLPENVALQVLEETENQIYLVLPTNPYAGITEAELRETLGLELEDIADWVLDQQKGILADDKKSNIQLVAKAWRDNSFKNALIANSTIIIQQELGIEVDDKVSIQVLEETLDKLFIVIPYLADITLIKNYIDTQSYNLPLIVGSNLGSGLTSKTNQMVQTPGGSRCSV